MASNRHLGRIIALQTLYEHDFRRDAEDKSFDLEEVLTRNISRYKAMVDDVAFIRRLVEGAIKHEEAMNAVLQPVAPDWPMDQIARMDRVILHIGLYELDNEADVPPKVVINEAVELAKAFGGENSSKFVNGVLGTLLRNRTGEPTDPSAGQPSDQSSDPKAAPKKTSRKTANDPSTPSKEARKAEKREAA
jgi:N utilization substance protein B